MASALRIDIWSDYVCPFCYLELTAVSRLQQEYGRRLQIVWRAFELRPEPQPPLAPDGDYLRGTWTRSVYPMAQERGMTLPLQPVPATFRQRHSTPCTPPSSAPFSNRAAISGKPRCCWKSRTKPACRRMRCGKRSNRAAMPRKCAKISSWRGSWESAACRSCCCAPRKRHGSNQCRCKVRCRMHRCSPPSAGCSPLHPRPEPASSAAHILSATSFAHCQPLINTLAPCHSLLYDRDALCAQAQQGCSTVFNGRLACTAESSSPTTARRKAASLCRSAFVSAPTLQPKFICSP